MAKIFIVEDDSELAGTVSRYLQADRHIVVEEHDGVKAFERLRVESFDIIVLDWDLPNMTGLDILKEMRTAGDKTLVIMLTGKTEIENKEAGIDGGADDYLTKPFDVRELAVRIRGLMRRATGTPSKFIQVNDLKLDAANYQVFKNDKEVRLTPKDFALLEFFMRHPGQIFSMDAILDRVWGHDTDASIDGLRAAIRRVRKVIDSTDDPSLSMIENVNRVGYRLRVLA